MSEVLKPELLWIENRCYRINETKVIPPTTYKEPDLYETEVTYNEIIENEGDENDDFEVTMVEDNKYTTSFHVSQYYHGAIIGKKAVMKSKLEFETKTEIKIPRQGHNGDIVIFGKTAESVKKARKRIHALVIASRLKQRLTHFVSIPMNDPVIMSNFNKFKESVLSEFPVKALDKSVFIPTTKLHITIGALCLTDNEEKFAAIKLLEDAKATVIMPIVQKHLPLKLRLKGLSYMNDDPTEIHVLYGDVHEEPPTGVLQKLADSLVEYFDNAGFMNKKEFGRDSVKLHVTLINSRYRDQESCEGNEGTAWKHIKTPRIPFDGSGILKKYVEYDFGVTEVNNIHLSQCNTLGPDGYYLPACVISFTK